MKYQPAEYQDNFFDPDHGKSELDDSDLADLEYAITGDTMVFDGDIVEFRVMTKNGPLVRGRRGCFVVPDSENLYVV